MHKIDTKTMGYAKFLLTVSLAWYALATNTSWAADNSRLKELERKIEEQQVMLEELKRQISELKRVDKKNSKNADKTQTGANQIQVEVFNKAIVTSDDPRFRVKVNGQVNRQVLYAYDGNKKKLYHTDSDNSPTRINIEASGHVGDDLTIGSRIESGYQDNRPIQVNQNNENAGFDFTSRWAEVYLDSKCFGKLGIGKGFASSFFLNETDFSGTQVVSLLSPGNLFGGLLFYNNDVNNYSDIKVADVFVDLEGASIVNRVRYDSPQLLGLQISGSTGSDQRNDVTIRWKNEVGDFKFAGASSYQRNPFGGLADWRVDGAISTLHTPTGLNLTGGAFKARAKSDNRHLDGFIVKGGWRKKFFSFGETKLSADFVRNFDTISKDEEATSFSAFWVQAVDNWGLQFYAGYRYYDLDSNDFDTAPIHVPVIGTIKYF